MSRTQRQGLKYAKIDTRFFSDEKILLLKARYGADGIAILVYVLVLIYSEGWYTKYDEDTVCIISDYLRMSKDKVEQVMTFLLGRGIFDENLARSDAILTGAGIQERWQEDLRIRDPRTTREVDGRYWLLKPEETAPFIKVTYPADNSRIIGDNSRIMPDNPGKNDSITLRLHSTLQVRIRIDETVTAFNRICVSFDPIKATKRTESYLASLCSRFSKEEIETLFKKCEQSDFLAGRKANFKATIRWLATNDNADKVLDGEYDDRKKRGAGTEKNLGDLNELEEIARRRASGKQEKDR